MTEGLFHPAIKALSKVVRIDDPEERWKEFRSWSDDWIRTLNTIRVIDRREIEFYKEETKNLLAAAVDTILGDLGREVVRDGARVTRHDHVDCIEYHAKIMYLLSGKESDESGDRAVDPSQG